MLKSIKGWLGGLSLAGKVIAYTAAAVIGGTVVTSLASSDNKSPEVIQPEVKSVSDVKGQSEPKIETKIVTETAEIPFAKSTVNDGNLDKDVTAIRVAGVNGIKTFTYKVTLTDGKQTSKELAKEEITSAPISEVTAIGTKVKPTSNCDPNYTPCVPNVTYDLDCPDIGFSVRVIGSDPHRFDRDGDGYGCESY